MNNYQMGSMNVPPEFQGLWDQATQELNEASQELNLANQRFQVALHAKLALKEVIHDS